MKSISQSILSKFGSLQYTINSDAFDRRKYYSVRQHSEFLQQKEEEGIQKLHTFRPLICDVFCALYKFNPQLRSRFEIRPLYYLNRSVMKQVLKTPEYEELRINTHFDELASLWATERFMDKLLSMLEELPDKKTRKLLEGLDRMMRRWTQNDPSSSPGPPQPNEDSSRARVGSGGPPQTGQNQAPSSPSTSPSPQPTPQQARQLEKLEKGIQRTLGQLESQIEEIVPQIMSELAEESEGEQAIAVLCRGWGLEQGSLTQLDPAQRIELAKNYGPKLKRLAELVGRYRRLALTKQQTRTIGLPQEVFNVTVGSDLDRILPSELANLVHPYLKYDFYRRFTEGKLLQYDLRGREPMGRGPLLVCIDCSGSMSGEPEIVAKAIGLGLLDIARMQKRNFVAILFGSPGEKMSFPFLKREGVSINRVIEFAASFYGGGTDYETPLHEAISHIELEDFKKGDIVFITDGICDVADSFLTEYNAVKTEKEFVTYSILITGQESQPEPEVLKKISDKITLSTALDEQVAGQVFSCV